MEWFNVVTISIGLITICVNALMIFRFGPVQAAKLTRELQREAGIKERKLSVFRQLAATRKTQLNPDHVWALNLVPIEFSGIASILSAWRSYIEQLGFRAPADDAQQQAFFHERDRRLMALIEEIAKDLGVQFDRMDIHNYSYAPQGWLDDEFDQRMVRRLLVDLLRGMRGLPVTPFNPQAGKGPFPPAPDTAIAPSNS